MRPFLTVVGHLTRVGATPAARTRQTTQVLVDAMRRQTGADLAINPNGDGLFDVLRHRAVTRYDVYAAMPFHDNVLTAGLTGAEGAALMKSYPDTVVSGNAAPLDASKTYRVAFVDYEARSAYKVPEARLKETGQDERDMVIAYLGRGGAAGSAQARAFVTTAPPDAVRAKRGHSAPEAAVF